MLNLWPPGLEPLPPKAWSRGDDEGLKGEAGVASFATLCIAAYGCLIRERADFPPQAPAIAKKPAFPAIVDPPIPPVRPELHVQNAIATVRRLLTVGLAKSRARCPCCQKMRNRLPRREFS